MSWGLGTFGDVCARSCEHRWRGRGRRARQVVWGLPPTPRTPPSAPGLGDQCTGAPASQTGTDSGTDSSPRGSNCRACSHPGPDPFLARQETEAPGLVRAGKEPSGTCRPPEPPISLPLPVNRSQHPLYFRLGWRAELPPLAHAGFGRDFLAGAWLTSPHPTKAPAHLL